MKKITFLRNLIVLVALLIGSGSAMGQTTIFIETMGTVSATTTIAAHETANGFDNDSFTMSGTADLRNTTVSTGYTGASGVANVFFTNTNGRYFLIEGINTSNYTDITLSLGHYKSTTASNNELKIEVSSDGTNWTQLTYSRPTGTGTTTWVLITPTGTIPSVENLQIRFTQTSSTPQFRIDDIKLTGTLAPSCTASNLAFGSPTTVEKLAGDNNFTKTATSLNETTAIVYSSSDTDVATVNSSTGEVDILAAGTTTITATQAAGTHNSVDYCAGEVTYTLNVAPVDPTITVTEETVPAMSIAVGGTDTETITVNASNLTGNITLAVTGDDADLFTLSTYTLVHSSGSVSNQSVTITYTPDAPAASHTATLTLSSPGAESVPKNLSGSATLAKPTATDATGISPSGFTANWDAVPGATSYELKVYKKEQALNYTTDLIISEYIEGSSFNKSIELFNGTGSSVDLSLYSIKKQTNGVGEYKDDLILSGILANNNVYVISYVSGSNSASAGILAVTDLQTPSSALNYNGNDAVALFKDDVKIDEVGVFNQVADWGKDVTLVRKSSVAGPEVTYDASDWDSYSVDYISDLGSHTYDGLAINITPVSGSPFTVTGETSKAITGLTASTQYFYTVKAINGSFESLVSEEETVTTSFGTSTDNPSSLTSIYAHNAKIHFAATAGEKIEVYNAVGQKIISTLATDGQNELSVNAKGVMIVKVGSRLAKVIL